MSQDSTSNTEYPYSIKIGLIDSIFNTGKEMTLFLLEHQDSTKVDYYSYSTRYKTYLFKNREDYLAFIMKFGQYEYKGNTNDGIR